MLALSLGVMYDRKIVSFDYVQVGGFIRLSASKTMYYPFMDYRLAVAKGLA